MKLEHKYSTVSQSKRLKELGIVQGKSERYWYTGDTGNNTDHLNITGSNYKGDDMCYSAFDVAEFGQMLPYRLHDEEYKENPHLRIYRGEDEWAAEYHVAYHRPFVRLKNAYEFLAQMLADLLIYLLENKLITPESVNDRLQNS